MRWYRSMTLALAIVLGHSVAGSAQSLRFTLSPAVPNQEVGIGAGLWNTNGGFVMGRFTLGPDYSSSPMIGGGPQSVWYGPIALRADLQVFPRGLSSEGHGRRVLSLALGLPDLR